MSEEWSDWVAHDGKGCPVVGMYVQGRYTNGRIGEGIPESSNNNPPRGYWSCWKWDTIPPLYRGWEIVEYRVRKPRELIALRELIADLPDKSPTKDPEHV